MQETNAKTVPAAFTNGRVAARHPSELTGKQLPVDLWASGCARWLVEASTVFAVRTRALLGSGGGSRNRTSPRPPQRVEGWLEAAG
jgi:hypothetical protein